MYLRTRKRLKTWIITFGILMIAMFTILNILASEFPVSNAASSTVRGVNSELANNYQNSDEDMKFRGYEYIIVQGQRKPKMSNMGQDSEVKVKLYRTTLKMRNNHERRVVENGFTQDEGFNEENYNKLNGGNKEFNGENGDFNNGNKEFNADNGDFNDEENNEFNAENEDDQEYNDAYKGINDKVVEFNEGKQVFNDEEINDKILNDEVFNDADNHNDDMDYDEGEENYDEDDYDSVEEQDDENELANNGNNIGNTDDKEYHGNFPTNAPFKSGDFGDITGLEYYAKPKLKFEEVKIDVADGKGAAASDRAAVVASFDERHGVKHRKKLEHNDILEDAIDDNNSGGVLDKENGGLKSRQSAVKLTNGKREGGQETHEDLVENKMFWSSYVESLVPKGLPYVKVNQLLHEWRAKAVQTLSKPSWNRCGRPLNGYVVLEDGTKMCGRYREPHNSFVYGESLSFFLSLILNMDNVPVVILSTTTSTSRQWRAANMSSLTWKDNRTVALIQWIENLSSKAYIPPLLLKAYRSGRPVTSHVINNSSAHFSRNPTQLSELVQWGTMIAFDYLTGNYDRVASMQDAEEKEHKPHIMEEPIRNLYKSAADGKLWLIDNESGLLDAYDLLGLDNQQTRFSAFHDQMLRTTCVFQSSFVKALKELYYKNSYPHKRLLSYAQSLEPKLRGIDSVKFYDRFVKLFDLRVKNVVDWINHCELMDGG